MIVWHIQISGLGHNLCREHIYMLGSLAREIGLLQTLSIHLERRSLPAEELTERFLRREGLGHAFEKGQSFIAIRTPGHKAFPRSC